jgi:hypothetical protein
MATVDGSAIPDEDHLAGDLAQQVLEKRDDVVRVDGVVLAAEVQLAFWGDRTDRRERLARPPLSQDGCLPHRGIGAHHTG